MARNGVRTIASAAGCALAMLSATGCVVEAGSAFAAPAGGVVVSGPPPAPMSEARPLPPDTQAVWIAGYWHWSGMQYAWIPGHWERAAPGARWHGPRYMIRDGTYYYEPGGWSR